VYKHTQANLSPHSGPPNANACAYTHTRECAPTSASKAQGFPSQPAHAQSTHEQPRPRATLAEDLHYVAVHPHVRAHPHKLLKPVVATRAAQAEAALLEGLRRLAVHPPAPLLAAGCCSAGTAPSLLAAPHSPVGAAAAQLGALWGAPQCVGLEALVRDLLEACLRQQEQAEVTEGWGFAAQVCVYVCVSPGGCGRCAGHAADAPKCRPFMCDCNRGLCGMGHAK